MADAGVDDVACLTSPPKSIVQYADTHIMNLHFHANSEHTQRGVPDFFLAIALFDILTGLLLHCTLAC